MSSQGKHRGRSKSIRSRRSEAGDVFLKEAMKQSISSKHAEEAIACSKKISELKTWVRAKKTESLPPASSTKQEVESRRSNSLHSRFPASAYLLAYKDLKDQQKRALHHQTRILEQGKKPIQEGNRSLNNLFETKKQETERKPMDDDSSTVKDMFDMFNWSSSSFNRVEMPSLTDCSDNENEKRSQVRGRRLRSSQEARESRSMSVHSLKSTHTCSTRSCSVSTKRDKRKSKSSSKSERSKITEIRNLYAGPPRDEGTCVGLPAAA
mmetsp:Transcript_10587/g.11667  ORF Transcript_10587/g.11667 Transcript_10587/m.11667 type:complete len:266 (+) Transcript_10587:1-798(+)|eukprot:CAMPEP_0195290334 /NCGR_PEP_ID=MMETSP0707-20130614/6243_1 /TAXON_ID=33640 /ORGANISM="Asterionellopsis glacialis, Strain CCMP134" /LENGTH=265 /DNA_ID=CAMNT_0040350449 /DNA_START=169 /DNA_END=966 /DNA_ORIENTATION=-